MRSVDHILEECSAAEVHVVSQATLSPCETKVHGSGDLYLSGCGLSRGEASDFQCCDGAKQYREDLGVIDIHIGCATSGLIADSRTMVDRARVDAQNYWFVYNEPMSVESVTQSVSNLAIMFGKDDDEKPRSRPFGTALLIGGVDEKGPQLWHLDPSGTYTLYEPSGSEGAQTSLQEVYHKTMTINEAEEKLLTILKQVMEEKLTASNVEGRLFQVEYAIEAIKLGSTAVGICTSEGVVLALEKRVTSTLMEPSSIEKILEIHSHIGCAMSGLIADSRTMVDRARVDAQNHWFVYNEPMSVESVTQSVSNLAMMFGEDDDEKPMSRPFGTALLIGGVDEKGPQLWHLDPSGTYTLYEAKAIGSGSEGAQTSLQEVYHKSMTINEAEEKLLTILKQVMEEKLTASNVEMAAVRVGGKYEVYSSEKLEAILARIKP